ncbi:hypothetical protein FA95DRAFT_1566654, partial [Auriscalpium vulgare]
SAPDSPSSALPSITRSSTPSSPSRAAPSSTTPSTLAPIYSVTQATVVSVSFLTTAPNGVVTTVVVQHTQTIIPSEPSQSGSGRSSSSSSNTGVIAGGAAGGVTALLLFFLVFWWCRRRRQRDDFDGIFDPDRVVRHSGRDDLVGAEATPYAYDPAAGGAGARPGPALSDGSSANVMRQYPDGKALLAYGGAGAAAASTGSASHYAPTDPEHRSEGSHYPPTSPSRSSFPAGAGAQDFHRPSPGPSLPSSGTSTSYQTRASKEAAAGFALANAEEGASAGPGPATPVIQHQDGGRVAQAAPREAPQEIPPSYDSIPADQR